MVETLPWKQKFNLSSNPSTAKGKDGEILIRGYICHFPSEKRDDEEEEM
jgi:hypothetical protein